MNTRRLRASRMWRPGRLATATLAMTWAIGLRTIFQALVFLIVARGLGAESYGGFAAVLAIAGTFGTFSGLGVQSLMIRDVSRDPASFSKAWGRVLGATWMSAPILFGAYCLLAWAILPAVSWTVIALLGVAELLFAPLALASVRAFQSHERMHRAARLVLLNVVPRLAAALLFAGLTFAFPADLRLSIWSMLYALASLAAAVIGVRLVHRELGPPTGAGTKTTRLGEGIAFALNGTALKLYAEIDKAMLARLGTLEAAGAYSAAYRLVDMAAVPLQALFASTTPRFFAAGESGTGAAIRYAIRILPLPLLYAGGLGAVLFFSADLLPRILGSSFTQSVDALRWLAWLPLLGTLRRLPQAALNASGRQRAATIATVFGAVLTIALNLWTIRRWGIQGAVAATYCAELAMLSILLANVVLRSSRLHTPHSSDGALRQAKRQSGRTFL